MCTVTFLPKEGGYILTSNRDEDPGRSQALSPNSHNSDYPNVYFPKDPLGQGSWIAFSQSGKTICLLNGGHEKHKRSLPYRHSRGLVVLAAFDYEDPYLFKEDYNLNQIEAFTIVWVAENERLFSLVWDEKELSIEERDYRKPWIWSSVTLYEEPIRLKRISWFAEWQKAHREFDQRSILEFHHFGGEGNSAIDLKMEKKGLIPKTISVTSVERSPKGVHYLYEDLLSNEKHEGQL